MAFKFKKFPKVKHIKNTFKVSFWFTLGALIGLFFVTTSAFLLFQKINENKVYPGVIVNGINLGGKNAEEVKKIFQEKNDFAIQTKIIFVNKEHAVATASAKEIDLGFDSGLISAQAISLGRSDNLLTNIYLISKAYVSGIYLPVSYRYSEEKVKEILAPFAKSVEKTPVDALFKFENGKVTAFRTSEEGKTLDFDYLNENIRKKKIPEIANLNPSDIKIEVPIKIIKPLVTTENTNQYGIKELIGVGKSTFFHSIQSRVYNIVLAAGRINGTLVAPGEIFSFDKALGDVSAYTGYRQAYIIQNGKTILGDGGGVCQVSTTFFRALLSAGLPIIERHAHSYRVGYYEQDSPPGIDATVYVPSVDLKFKNDTGHYILIQSEVDTNNMSLIFYLYGTKDGRVTNMTNPVITNQTPPPPDLYQDDPTLPKGEVKQVDFAASGANVYFTRTVSKNGETLYFDKFVSNYQPWQAVYLRGTKEN